VPGVARFYRLQVMNLDGVTVAFTFSSVPGGAGPYLTEAPHGDGMEINIFTGAMRAGSYVFTVADADLGAGVRAVTSQMADASGNYDKLARKAFYDTSTNGTTWSNAVAAFLTDIEIVGIVGIFTISDPLRIDKTTRVFQQRTAKFPRGTNIIGTPVDGGFGGVPDKGIWRVKVGAIFTGPPVVVRVDYVRGVSWTADLGQWWYLKPQTEHADYINRRALPYVQDDQSGASYPGLRAELVPVGAAPSPGGLLIPREVSTLLTPPRLIYDGQISLFWPGTTPTVGQEYDLKIYPLEVSQRAPLHIEKHPVDILTDLWTDAGIAYDAASAAAVREYVGNDRILMLRLTQSYTLADFQERFLFGLFGFHFRHTSTGLRELYGTRRLSSITPTVTVVTDDVRGDAENQPPVLTLSESGAMRSVTLRQQRFRKAPNENIGERPTDEVVSYTAEVTVLNEIAPAAGEEIIYDVPGNVTTTAQGKFDAASFGRDVIRRSGPTAEILISDTIAAKLGDVVISTIAHQVNGNVRGGSRRYQILRRTPKDAAVELKWIDAGKVTLLTVVPTFTVAASSSAPKSAFVVTLTNAAAVAAEGALVRVEWGFGATTPTSGTLLAIMNPATETVLSPPRVDSGAHVWIRTRAEHVEKIATAFSAWQGVDLADLTAPSGLSRTGNVLTWTPGEARQEPLWRLAAESVNQKLPLLPAGSNRFDLTTFVPSGTAIVATVRSHDEPPYAGVSAALTVSYTTPAGASLNAPTGVSASRLVEYPPEDHVTWSVSGNPSGTTYSIEQSTTGSGSGYSVVGGGVDVTSAVVPGTYSTDTWYRVRALNGSATSAYSTPYQLTV
jgi:hypothetical protein